MLHAHFAWSLVHISIHIHMNLERKEKKKIHVTKHNTVGICGYRTFSK